MFSAYGPSDMREFLKESFEPLMIPELYEPCVYNALHANIFPPVSDSETPSLGLTSILERLEKALPHLGSDVLKKNMLFPLAEEQATMLGSPSRKHWVTLHYDPITQVATLIDSTWLFGLCYSTAAIKQSLICGLYALEPSLTVKQFDIKYQGVQYDTTSCGAWTALNIEALAHGASIDDQMQLSVRDTFDVFEHVDGVVYGSKTGVYRRSNFAKYGFFPPINLATEDNESLGVDESYEFVNSPFQP